ncbi:MAG: GNAT family N-acetyltransferase [Candidatus Lokiarchaeota archaeon]|nr:GNAT family N-acetyltransferase [Candidatus Lokiarchaeota archaeon]
MTTEIVRATRDMMVHVQDIINSNYHLYEGIVDARDLGEHRVDEAWAERNFAIREFYLLRGGDNERFVGFGSFQLILDFAYVGYLYVRHGYQHRGYGQELVSFLGRRAIEAGACDLRLFVNEKASWARNFYTKTGFSVFLSRREEILAMDGGIMAPFYEEHSLLMRKPLGYIP